MAEDPVSPVSPHITEAESSRQGAQGSVRWSQYAENRANPLPEVAVNSEAAPETASDVEEPKAPDNVNPLDGVPVTRPPGPIQPDGGDPRSPAVMFSEPKKSWWKRNQSWGMFGVLVIVVALAATIIGVVVATRPEAADKGSPA